MTISEFEGVLTVPLDGARHQSYEVILKLYGTCDMNKYMGFYELKRMNLPSVPWKQFTHDTALDEGLLWTVRVAVESSNDLNLPRAVGVMAHEAVETGKMLLHEYAGKGMVIYYPYFIAEKSGVLDINSHRTVIEAVDRDLWNLVTLGKKDVTAVFPIEGEPKFIGNRYFLSEKETEELLKYSDVIRGRFRQELIEGKNVFAEWSYAYSTDIKNQPIGDSYIVFYELRCL